MASSSRFLPLLALLLCAIICRAQAEQCGSQSGGALCPGGLCWSQWGWCGSIGAYCGAGCQSQCGSDGGGGGGDLSSIISEATFNQMLLHRNDAACPANGFYTYGAFLAAAKSLGGFGTTGDDATRKREIAAFFGQTSHETTGGWSSAPDGPNSWGYCFKQEQGNPGDYCNPNGQWPCAPGKKYYGRGPMQLS